MIYKDMQASMGGKAIRSGRLGHTGGEGEMEWLSRDEADKAGE